MAVRASFLVHEVGGEEKGEEPEWLPGSGGRNGTRVVSGDWHPPETDTRCACNSGLSQSGRKKQLCGGRNNPLLSSRQSTGAEISVI
jgi:hypothetical protein